MTINNASGQIPHIKASLTSFLYTCYWNSPSLQGNLSSTPLFQCSFGTTKLPEWKLHVTWFPRQILGLLWKEGHRTVLAQVTSYRSQHWTLRTIVNWKWFKKTFHHNLGFYQTEVFTHYPLKTVFNRTLCKTLFLTKNLLENSNYCSVVSTVHCLMLFS